MTRRLLAAAFWLCCSPTALLAWGYDEHKIVAELAWERMSPQSRAVCESLLASESFIEVSTWADFARDERRYAWTDTFHYINVPLGAAIIDMDRDCPEGRCVIGAIRRFATELGDNAAPAERRAVALKFVIHFVGDAHQPMHAGYKHDRGGNDIRLVFMGSPTNLHRLWDFEMTQASGVDRAGHLELARERITPDSLARWQRIDDPLHWVQESHRLAVARAYQVPLDGQIGREYMIRSLPLIHERLAAAAVRLADLLDRTLISNP